MSISVLGGGAWATALAAMIARTGKPVTLWARNPETVNDINKNNRNQRYLGEIELPHTIRATSDLHAVLEAKTVLCVIPTQSLRSVLPQIADQITQDSHLVLCSKGIDRETGKLPHDLAGNYLHHKCVAALSGPSFAHDVANGLPTAVSLAATDIQLAKGLSAELSAPQFRIYATDDITGVEIGGALKNVLAIAVGVARGLKLGASAEAALIARGFAELNRLATALGARAETMSGLSGLGDLVLTCSSTQSRNFSYGCALATGETLENRPLAEGAHTAAMALELSNRYSVDVPIVSTVCALLENELTAQDAVAQLLARPLREE